MKVLSNIHTHTRWSDGNDTAEEMVQEAIRRGFHTVGISDHGVTPFDLSYCIQPQAEQAYLAELKILKEKYAGQIDVLSGVEYDYGGEDFGGQTAETDYVIGSQHYLRLGETYYALDRDVPEFQRLLAEFHGDSLELAKRYYDDLVRRTAKVRPDVVGHFDLLTKFGLVEESEAYRTVASQAMTAVVQEVGVVEINTGAMARGVRQMQYPADFLLPVILKSGGEVILSSDAHRKENLAFAFEEMCALLRRVGFSHVLERRKDAFVPAEL